MRQSMMGLLTIIILVFVIVAALMGIAQLMAWVIIGGICLVIIIRVLEYLGKVLSQ